MKRLIVALSLTCLAALWSGPAPALETSVIQVPVRVPLASLTRALEEQVPRVKDHWNSPVRYHGVNVKYRLWRGPLAVWMGPDGLHVSTRVAYQVRAGKKLLGSFKLSAGCGVGEPPRQVMIHLVSWLQWTADWRLRSRTRVYPNQFLNPCRVSFAKIDITPLIDRYLSKELVRRARRTIDARIPQLANLKDEAEQAWKRLQQPVEVADHTWLLVRPEAIRAGPLYGDQQTVSTLFQLTAHPQVVVGDRPAAGQAPLPPLRPAALRPPGFTIAADVRIGYAEANERLAQHLLQHSVDLAGKSYIVSAVRVGPGKDGVRLKLSLIGAMGIPMEVTARLDFDPQNQTLRLQEPEYRLDTDNTLARLTDQVFHKTLVKLLEAQLQWPMQQRITGLKTKLEKALNRDLGHHARLQTKVTKVRPGELTAGAEAMEVPVMIEGNIEVLMATAASSRK